MSEINKMPENKIPGIYVSHGSPDMALTNSAAANFLRDLPKDLPQPDGIVIISAHWLTRGLHITTAGPLETIHDFQGFPPELYQLNYPAVGTDRLIEQLSNCLSNQGYHVTKDKSRGLDHGAWTPLVLMYPKADIPVVQLSLDATLSGTEHLAVGRVLAALRDSNILVITSGSSVHNLSAMASEGSKTPDWAIEFEDWINQTLSSASFDELADFYHQAPHAKQAHPTTEHFLPIIVAAGVGGADAKAKRIHHGFSYGSIGMSAWSFD